MHLQISIPSPSSPYLLPIFSPHSYSKTPFFGFGKSPLRSLALQSRRWRTTPVVCSISQAYNYGTVDYERRPSLRWSALYRRISLQQDPSIGTAEILYRWEVEGRHLTKRDLLRTVKELRKYRKFTFALEIYEWMGNQGKRFRFISSDAAVKLDLISKVHGVSSAEDYFLGLPYVLKDNRTYGALLNAYARAKIKEKAETLFVAIQDRGYITDVLPYNVMMTLYLNTKEYGKVISMITEMKEHRLRLDIFSYNIWITACGAMGDLEQMEEVVQQMRLDKRVNADWTTYTTLAGIYIKHGDSEKAEKCMMDVELRITGRHRGPFHYLLGLYSNIGKKDEVYRVWNYYKSCFPRMLNLGYLAMLSALARLRDIEGAESIYEEWLSVKVSYDARLFNVLIVLYNKEGMLEKAQTFLDRVLETGGSPNQNTWEVMADGYVRRKQISKALSCLKEAASIESQMPWQPRHPSVSAFLALCEELGDTASKEMLAELLRKAGCPDIETYGLPGNTTVRPFVAIDDSDLALQGNYSDEDSVTQMHLTQHELSL